MNTFTLKAVDAITLAMLAVAKMHLPSLSLIHFGSICFYSATKHHHHPYPFFCTPSEGLSALSRNDIIISTPMCLVATMVRALGLGLDIYVSFLGYKPPYLGMAL